MIRKFSAKGYDTNLLYGILYLCVLHFCFGLKMGQQRPPKKPLNSATVLVMIIKITIKLRHNVPEMKEVLTLLTSLAVFV